MDNVSKDQQTAPPEDRTRGSRPRTEDTRTDDAKPKAPKTKDPGPGPEPIRFFGTTWVLHDGGYGWRRAGVGFGALLAAALGALVLRIGFSGLADAKIGTFLTVVAVIGFGVCSVLAFQRTWRGFSARRAPGESSDQGLYAVGFIGALLAYATRCLTEAPGETLHRTEYEAARARHTARTGRPKPKPQGRRKR